MPSTRSLMFLVALAFAACGAPEDDLGPDAGDMEDPIDASVDDLEPIELSLYTDNQQGNLALVKPAVTTVLNNGGASTWRTIDRMSSVIYTRSTDAIEVEVAGTITASGTVWMRVLVDGAVALPSEVRVHDGGTDAFRSFRFVRAGMAQGAHVVEVQWKGDPAASLTGRTLTVNAGNPSWGTGRMVVAASGSPTAPNENSSMTWVDVPGLSQQITVSGTRQLVVAFSAESVALSGQWYARVTVDGVPRGDVIMQTAGTVGASLGARTYVLYGGSLSANVPHTVRVQWRSSGWAQLYQRTMTAFASGSSHIGGGLVALDQNGTVTSLGTSWTTVQQTSFSSWDPTAVAAITFSGELRNPYGKVLARAIVDGVAVPGVVTIARSGNQYQAAAATFHVKNKTQGTHSVDIQLRSDSSTGYVIDRSTAVHFKRRHGTDFAQPFRGPNTFAPMRPRHGSYRVIAICMDPQHEVDGFLPPKPSYEEFVSWFLPVDGMRSVAEWYMENSNGKFWPGPHQFTNGCFDAPLAHRGGWYWDEAHPERFATMHEDALTLADPQIDFRSYDTNGDHILMPDEAVVVIAKPQMGQSGQAWASVDVTVDNGYPLKVYYADVYLEPFLAPPPLGPPDPRPANVGLLAHEMSHLLLGAADLYFLNNPSGDSYSVMTNYGGGNHLDPAHKLVNGWLLPDVVDLHAWTSGTVSLHAVEQQGHALILYHSSRPTEAIIVENRWPDPSNYDATGLSPENGGIAVWQVVLDEAATAPWTWNPNSNKHLTTLDTNGEWMNLNFRDGTPTGFRVGVSSAVPSEYVNVLVGPATGGVPVP